MGPPAEPGRTAVLEPSRGLLAGWGGKAEINKEIQHYIEKKLVNKHIDIEINNQMEQTIENNNQKEQFIFPFKLLKNNV